MATLDNNFVGALQVSQARKARGANNPFQLSYVAGAAPPADVTGPAIGNYVPADGITVTKTQGIQFDVTDGGVGLLRVVVIASFEATGAVDVVHDGSGFRGAYAGTGSSRVAIDGGFRYVVIRKGGWPSRVAFEIIATDLAGNEVRV